MNTARYLQEQYQNLIKRALQMDSGQEASHKSITYNRYFAGKEPIEEEIFATTDKLYGAGLEAIHGDIVVGARWHLPHHEEVHAYEATIIPGYTDTGEPILEAVTTYRIEGIESYRTAVTNQDQMEALAERFDKPMIQSLANLFQKPVLHRPETAIDTPRRKATLEARGYQRTDAGRGYEDFHQRVYTPEKSQQTDSGNV